MTVLVATFSTVASPYIGGIAPRLASNSRSVYARASSTRSRVGWTTGRPSGDSTSFSLWA